MLKSEADVVAQAWRPQSQPQLLQRNEHGPKKVNKVEPALYFPFRSAARDLLQQSATPARIGTYTDRRVRHMYIHKKPHMFCMSGSQKQNSQSSPPQPPFLGKNKAVICSIPLDLIISPLPP
ncbi:hypothetical protein VTJ04DRAFT_1112 [Mycothermus thermophilus]|uniref:uncharacterized protein n=1 Tax=Humicola insolens TaxID=85995 RepID=UPI0037439252